MANPNISAALTDEDVAAVIAAVATIKGKIPFGVTLTPEQRQALPKLGTKSAGFVDEAQAAALTHPEILPGTFDATEFAKDAALFEQLLKVYAAVAPVAEMIEHTTMAVGSEAFAEARMVYQYVKTAARVTPGLQSVAEKLGERFKQTRTGEVTAAVKPS
jgi:hypothetical protein